MGRIMESIIKSFIEVTGKSFEELELVWEQAKSKVIDKSDSITIAGIFKNMLDVKATDEIDTNNIIMDSKNLTEGTAAADVPNLTDYQVGQRKRDGSGRGVGNGFGKARTTGMNMGLFRQFMETGDQEILQKALTNASEELTDKFM